MDLTEFTNEIIERYAKEQPTVNSWTYRKSLQIHCCA